MIVDRWLYIKVLYTVRIGKKRHKVAMWGIAAIRLRNFKKFKVKSGFL